MPAAARRKHEMKHKLGCSGNSDVCINLPHWDSVAPARAAQENLGSATPQLLHRGERTQVSAAEEAALVLGRVKKSHQRPQNHAEKMTQLKPCAVKTKLEPAQPVSIAHKPVSQLPRNGSDPSPRACPLQQVIHMAKCEVTIPHHTLVLLYRQNMSKLCPKSKTNGTPNPWISHQHLLS